MEKGQMKILGILLLVICAVCIFVAVERYQKNANNVRAMNEFSRSMPMGRTMIQGQSLKPAMPAATKYAILLALITGVSGGFFLVKGTGTNTPENTQQKTPDSAPAE